jgi:hypothetical protein
MFDLTFGETHFQICWASSAEMYWVEQFIFMANLCLPIELATKASIINLNSFILCGPVWLFLSPRAQKGAPFDETSLGVAAWAAQ